MLNFNKGREVKMKCKEVQALLSPYMDGELEEAKIPLIQEHLKTCDKCMELYQSWQAIEDLTKQTLIGTEPSEDYWNSFTYRLHWRINKDKANKVAAKQVWWRRIFAPTFTRSLSGVAVVFIMLLFGLDYHKKQSQLPLSPVNTIDGTLYYDDMKSITRDERKTYLVDEEFASETIEDISSAPLLASETGKLITTEFARGIEAEAPIDDYFTEPETPVPTTEIVQGYWRHLSATYNSKIVKKENFSVSNPASTTFMTLSSSEKCSLILFSNGSNTLSEANMAPTISVITAPSAKRVAATRIDDTHGCTFPNNTMNKNVARAVV